LTPEYKSDRNVASRNGGRAVALTIAGGLLFTAVYGAWWVLTPEHAYRVSATKDNGSVMVLDSPEARRLINSREPIANQAAILVAQDSYARILQKSQTRCEGDVVSQYTLVRITSGPSRGKEGWLCSGRDFRPTIWNE
jgi:hypothetical protein